MNLMPAIFFGHGNPMNAISKNVYTGGWASIGKSMPHPRAVRFEKHARELMQKGDDGKLISYERLGHDAMLSVPTPDHYLPLLYVIALRREGEKINFPIEGVDGGSVSMLSVRIG